MLKRIDHIAIAVEDIERALTFFRDVLGLELSHTETVPEQGVQVAFLPLGDSDIELLEPLSPDTGVAKFLARQGEGIHHICLEVEDIEAALAGLKDQGVRLINETPVAGAHGRVAFIYPKSTHGVLIELVELYEPASA